MRLAAMRRAWLDECVCARGRGNRRLCSMLAHRRGNAARVRASPQHHTREMEEGYSDDRYGVLRSGLGRDCVRLECLEFGMFGGILLYMIFFSIESDVCFMTVVFKMECPHRIVHYMTYIYFHTIAVCDPAHLVHAHSHFPCAALTRLHRLPLPHTDTTQSALTTTDAAVRLAARRVQQLECFSVHWRFEPVESGSAVSHPYSIIYNILIYIWYLCVNIYHIKPVWWLWGGWLGQSSVCEQKRFRIYGWGRQKCEQQHRCRTPYMWVVCTCSYFCRPHP